jgi:hypothetical protein
MVVAIVAGRGHVARVIVVVVVWFGVAWWCGIDIGLLLFCFKSYHDSSATPSPILLVIASLC